MPPLERLNTALWVHPVDHFLPDRNVEEKGGFSPPGLVPHWISIMQDNRDVAVYTMWREPPNRHHIRELGLAHSFEEEERTCGRWHWRLLQSWDWKDGRSCLFQSSKSSRHGWEWQPCWGYVMRGVPWSGQRIPPGWRAQELRTHAVMETMMGQHSWLVRRGPRWGFLRIRKPFTNM